MHKTCPPARRSERLKYRRSTGTNRHGGTTLVEVLVAILIFSFGFLGFVGLQARALQFSVGTEDNNRAALIANEMVSVMVARQTLDTELLKPEIAAWQARARNPAVAGLANASASTVSRGGIATIRIAWRSTGAAGGLSEPDGHYTTQVVLP